MVQIVPRSCVNAIRCPSGENRGAQSSPARRVSRFWPLPSAFMT